MKEISENKFCAIQKRDSVNVLYGKYRKRCNLLSIEHINNSAYLLSFSDRCLQFVFQTYLILQSVIIIQKNLLLFLLFSSFDLTSDVDAAIRQKIICMGSLSPGCRLLPGYKTDPAPARNCDNKNCFCRNPEVLVYRAICKSCVRAIRRQEVQ